MDDADVSCGGSFRLGFLLRLTGVPLLDRALGPISPELPVLLVGPPGGGRTVVCLQLAATALAEGESVVYVTAEPPGALVAQANSLGLDLEDGIRGGRLVMLHLVPDLPSLLPVHGMQTFLEALRDEAANPDFAIFDPISSLLPRFADEGETRAAFEQIFHGPARPRAGCIAAIDGGRLAEQATLERSAWAVCGAILEIEVSTDGQRSLRTAKSRSADAETAPISFVLGRGGTQIADGLPAPTTSPIAPGPGPERAPDARPRILVVDAHDADAAAVTSWLAEVGEVTRVGDAATALSALLREPPDLIVLDLLLPDLPGYEILSAVQRSPLAIPILVVSERMARAADRVRVLVLGAVDALTKPVSQFELVHKALAALASPALGRTVSADEEADLLLLCENKQRATDESTFSGLLANTVRFGERFGIGSSLVAVEAEGAEALECFVKAAEGTLRAEDALFVFEKTRALLLLPTADPAQADRVVVRLQSRAEAESQEPLSFEWRSSPVAAGVDEVEWESWFDGLGGEWSEGESG